ncbi:MAG TPA: SAF domain-containing protein [Polyangia bacterium]|nr:SAF domain-containing protein [Polyangia bacterium]
MPSMRPIVFTIVSLAVAGVATLAPAAPATGAERVPAVVLTALERALSVPGARLDDAQAEGGPVRTCPPREVEVPRAVDGSGRVAIKVIGTRAGGARCEAWSWVRVRVVADVAVTRRALRAGDALAGAVVTETRELVPGRPPADPATLTGAVAAHALPAGAVVEADAATVATARPGEPVKVVLMTTNGLAIEQSGHAVPCVRGRSCAVLPSGKHVEGDLIDGRILVTLP